MEYIVIAAKIVAVIALAVLCLIASVAEIWKTYDIDMDEWEEELEDENDMPILQNKVYSKKR
jgi:hypothetical protein